MRMGIYAIHIYARELTNSEVGKHWHMADRRIKRKEEMKDEVRYVCGVCVRAVVNKQHSSHNVS